MNNMRKIIALCSVLYKNNELLSFLLQKFFALFYELFDRKVIIESKFLEFLENYTFRVEVININGAHQFLEFSARNYIKISLLKLERIIHELNLSGQDKSIYSWLVS